MEAFTLNRVTCGSKMPMLAQLKWHELMTTMLLNSRTKKQIRWHGNGPNYHSQSKDGDEQGWCKEFGLNIATPLNNRTNSTAHL
ncbi:hypothetical protein M514_04618 [Trichuris suis]|uniref:Uncharacterized protein n=1 Tax=Trichuris suis TaxID=68888 RepID=A0A085MB75_9BILA|nr:hypothetical protein M513_04618 [Trichuris suis]KFD73336.1 hypothetical protein M514_04618 [Trichuris suis]